MRVPAQAVQERLALGPANPAFQPGELGGFFAVSRFADEAAAEDTVHKRLTRPACFAYAVWVPIGQCREGKSLPEAGCGARTEEPPKVAGPL